MHRSMLRGLLCAAMLLASLSVGAKGQTTLQLAEDTAVSRDLDGTSPTRVCRTGAHWIRIGFESLTLSGDDRLELASSKGDRVVFQGGRWNTRSFYTRALRGSCVTLTRSFADGDSGYRLSGYQAGTQKLEDTTSVVAGAGDICGTTTTNCRMTSDLIVALNPSVALALGDNAYNSGTLSEYTSRYDPNWGRFKDITAPIPGNHEYITAGAAGYFDYFNGVGNQTGPAGDRSQGYYSYDLGDWHFIALNSRTGGTVSTAQLTWLDADLRANTKPCTAAYVHHPFISRGNYTGYASMKPFFDRLYASRADLFIVAHDHNYQRWAPMDGNKIGQADGVREVIVGTGGGSLYPVNGTHALLEAKQGTTRGVLKLALTATGYDGEFLPVEGQAWTDTFSGACHRASAIVGDYLLTGTPSISIPRGSSGGKVITVASYGGFSEPVSLAISGLPSGVTATWSVNPATPPADGNTTSRVTLRASSTATLGTFSVTVTGTAGEIERTFKFTLIVRSP